MSRTPPFTLADLLEQRELGLTLVAGDAARRVAGAHSVEVPEPARWLAPDWVMLSTGARLRHDADQRALVRELHAARVAALGMALGVAFEAPPGALLDEARRLGFAVLTVPFETPLREVVGTVHRALLSSELRALQRLSSWQRYLLDALHEPAPLQVVVARLGALLQAPVAVLRRDGTRVVPDEQLPVALPRPLPVGDGDRVEQLALGERTALLVGAGADHVVAAVVRDGAASDRLTHALLRAGAAIVAALARLDVAAAEQQRAVRAALLDELLGDEPAGPGLVERIAATGLDVRAVVQVLVAVSDAGEAADGGSAAARLARALELLQAGRPHLLRVRPREVVVLAAAGEEHDPAALASVLDRHGAVAGLGRPFATTLEAAASCADARAAAAEAAARGVRVCAHDELDLPAALVARLGAEVVEPRVRHILAALDERPDQRAALEAYLAHDLDVVAAATALHLHRNSLRYRLDRLAQRLGLSLRDPTAIASLVIALAAERRACPTHTQSRRP